MLNRAKSNSRSLQSLILFSERPVSFYVTRRETGLRYDRRLLGPDYATDGAGIRGVYVSRRSEASGQPNSFPIRYALNLIQPIGVSVLLLDLTFLSFLYPLRAVS